MSNSPLFSCHGKQAFNTFREGDRAIKRIRKYSHMTKNDGQLNLYRCSYCPAWHIGTRSNIGHSKKLPDV